MEANDQNQQPGSGDNLISEMDSLNMNEEPPQQGTSDNRRHGDFENVGDSWKQLLKQEKDKLYYKELQTFFDNEKKEGYTIYPPIKDVFAWTQYCNVRDVKVVILGQEPYHGPNQANGLCFSFKTPPPSPHSLQNIYKALARDVDGFDPPAHGDLTGWARQGVLLLNAVLTVRDGCENSHQGEGWELFTDEVIHHISSNNPHVVFMLWGEYAQKKAEQKRGETDLINKHRHLVLRSDHPMSANFGFFGCKHFSQANKWLKSQGVREISWNPRHGDLENVGKSWRYLLESESKKDYYWKLQEFLDDEKRKGHKISPSITNVFAWTKHCEVKDVKVVIVGQDPSPEPNYAHGLCFSVERPSKPCQSLNNIYKELTNDVPEFKDPGHGDLTKWAEQGVLLLNAILTVREKREKGKKGGSNSHAGKGWEIFTDAVIDYINTKNCKVVFMLWGNKAQEKEEKIVPNHYPVLTCTHPSNQSAKGTKPKNNPEEIKPIVFSGCKHFSQANKWLKDDGLPEINWCAL